MDRVDKRTEWKARFDAWQSSELSAAEWCREQNLNIHQMYYWIGKFKEKTFSSEESKTKWLTVNLPDSPPDHS